MGKANNSWDNWDFADPWSTQSGEASQSKSGDILPEDKKLYVRFMDTQYNRVDSIADLIKCLPKPNEQIRVVTQKSFNPFALLLYVVQQYEIKELFMAIYRIDIHSVTGLKKMVADNQIENLTIVLSSFHRTSKKSEKWHVDLKQWASQNKNVRLIYCWNHAKVLAIKTKTNEHFVIEGSGNLSDNARIEQYLFENSKASFDFHKGWMQDVYSFSAEKDVNEV